MHNKIIIIGIASMFLMTACSWSEPEEIIVRVPAQCGSELCFPIGDVYCKKTTWFIAGGKSRAIVQDILCPDFL